MHRISPVYCLCLAIVLLLAVGTTASAQLPQLVTRVPPTANAIAIVNAQAVRSGPSDASVIALPEGIEWYLMAAEMDFEFMQPLWEVAVAYLPEGVTMQEIANHSGGRLDRLAGAQAVERPNDSYVVSFGSRVVGAMSPANRPKVIRWARESQIRKAAEFSPFLKEAVAAAGDAANAMVIAFDLAGLLAPAEVSFALESSKALADTGMDVEQAASIMSGIVGIRLEVEMKDSAQAKLRLEFADDPSPLAEVAKPLLVEVLTKHGAHIESLPRWKVRISGKGIVLEGKLSSGGLRRIHSLLSGPVGPWTETASSGPTPENAMAEVSRAYFHSVTGYLNDLFYSDNRPQSMYQISVWVQRYSRKIEDLSTSGVDPDVKSYGADVVMSLREIASVVERSQQRTDLREATMFNSGRSRYGRYGAYGWFEKSYVTRDRALIQTDEAQRGLRGSEAIVNDLHGLTNQTRKTMTDRYEIEF
jgi:hypothetical protein